jgi:hypothetical protein
LQGYCNMEYLTWRASPLPCADGVSTRTNRRKIDMHGRNDMTERYISATAAGRLRHRLQVVAMSYLAAALVFGLLSLLGAQAAVNGTVAIGVPWTVAAAGALAGTLAISVAAWQARLAVVGAHVDTVRMVRAVAVAKRGRSLILLAAVGTAFASMALAPIGDEELTFVLVVDIGLAIVLALFAVVADDVNQAIRSLPPMSLSSVEQ